MNVTVSILDMFVNTGPVKKPASARGEQRA